MFDTNRLSLECYYWPAYTYCRGGRLVTVAGVCRISGDSAPKSGIAIPAIPVAPPMGRSLYN